MDLPEKIKRKRLGDKMTQRQFADKMGVTISMQKSYEIGKAEPNLLYMDKLNGVNVMEEVGTIIIEIKIYKK